MRLLIDPGHGGADPGCVHNGVQEKDFTLSMGLLLREICLPLGIAVDMTRVQDVSLPLQSRLGNGVYDLVLVLHADASPDPFAGALSVYISNRDSRPLSAGRAIAKHAPDTLRRSEPRVTVCGPGDWTYRAFNCLKNHTAPAILVECGFLSNQHHAAYLTSQAGKWGVAAALLHGISTARFGQRNVV